MKLYDLKTSHMINPTIDWNPEFSWKIETNKNNIKQVNYQIQVIGEEGILWDTGVVSSDRQAFIEYEGKKFQSHCKYVWRVRVETNKGEIATAETSFQTAFMSSEEWSAKWIECPFERKAANEYKFGNSYPPVRFLRKINIIKEVKRVICYASSHGVYKLNVNGNRADNRELAPEFTPYDRIMYYQTYDITKLLVTGENMLSMYVADGWYFSAQAGPVMAERHKEPSCIYEIHILYMDGSEEVAMSDGSEECYTDYITYSDLYQGEKQDFTIGVGEKYVVDVKNYDTKMLRAQPMNPICRIKEIPAISVIRTPAGEMVVDFGQVMAGRAQIIVDEKKDTVVTFEYFEILNDEGNYTNTMFAPQKDTVVSNGEKILHEALFTFHGFRYIKVSGMTDVKKESFTAILLSTQKEETGMFTTNIDRLNRLYQNIRWSQYSNMMSVPTDCPSREKAGWTGDILVYAKTAMMNEDMTPFLSSWLNSVRADQSENGTVKIVSPYMNLYDGMLRQVCKTFGDDDVTGVAGWSDAIIWVPYDMYRVTGNKKILRDNYEAMKKWADYVVKTAKEKRGKNGIPEEYDQYLWNTGFHFGEWLVPSRPNLDTANPYAKCSESVVYIGPFFGYMSIKKMAEISDALGERHLADKYNEIAQNMKEAIQNGIIRAGLLPNYLMGGFILAFAFELVPDDCRNDCKGNLLQLIENNGECLDTGFLATPYILDALCNLGETELAYKLFWQSKRPSWFYEVDHGATTIWEAWDADDAKKDGRYISFNHYAFGCVDDWMMRHIAGINTDTIGYKHLIICPDVNSGVLEFTRKFVTNAGVVEVSRKHDRLFVSIPCNATALVRWKGNIKEIGSGTYEF